MKSPVPIETVKANLPQGTQGDTGLNQGSWGNHGYYKRDVFSPLSSMRSLRKPGLGEITVTIKAMFFTTESRRKAEKALKPGKEFSLPRRSPQDEDGSSRTVFRVTCHAIAEGDGGSDPGVQKL